MTSNKFSIRSRIKSFRYAIAGIRDFVCREHNAWIHLAATLGVIIAAKVLKVSEMEAIVLALAIGLVWVAEILNTCLERTADLVSREDHPSIKYIKDLAAGAVLVAAVTAVVVGLIIFIPKIVQL
jgi:diacylglycerol kinase (ATP)